MSKPRWDIFCKIVDNFGDIGVCWRLAKQLAREHGLPVRLWVDDLNVARQLMPSLNLTQSSQMIDKVEVAHWQAQTIFTDCADVVIETFACGLPDGYWAHMVAQGAKWVNVDYLSAESWVEGFHGKASPQANGLTRYFFFPGFTSNTGGLIREAEVTQHIQNALDLSFPQKREYILNRQSHWIPASAGMTDKDEAVMHISLFCYSHAPIAALLKIFTNSAQPIHLFVPATTTLPTIAKALSFDHLQEGDVVAQGALILEVLPFLSQDDYDALLANCDINFVRGEDSWVRAIWAGKPFIWQPYLQAEDTHKTKLEAFLNLFYQNLATNAPQSMHHAWLGNQDQEGNGLADAWYGYVAQLSNIATHTQQQANHLKKQQDLATQMVIFCNHL